MSSQMQSEEQVVSFLTLFIQQFMYTAPIPSCFFFFFSFFELCRPQLGIVRWQTQTVDVFIDILDTHLKIKYLLLVV